MQVKSSGGETSASGFGGLAPMELDVRDAGRCPMTNTKSYARKMRVFTVATQMQGTLHMAAL